MMKKIGTIMIILAVSLVLVHNVSPHHHNHKNVAEREHVCVGGNEHIEGADAHNDLCRKVYEFLTQNVTVSHAEQLAVGFYFDVTPHVCTCRSTFKADDEVSKENDFWERAFLRRGPPFLA